MRGVVGDKGRIDCSLLSPAQSRNALSGIQSRRLFRIEWVAGFLMQPLDWLAKPTRRSPHEGKED
jgi:hypothetical protein